VSARAWFVTALLAALLAPGARAQEAPADSSLRAYFRAMSDSTDAYFGLSAQPADTAGLDSALEYGLSLPPGSARGRAARVSFAPALSFNRALGTVYGGSASLSDRRRFARLAGRLQWANGPDDWYGGGELTLGRALPGRVERTTLQLGAGRRFEPLNRDYYNATFATIAAFFYGSDRHSYLRRDGMRAELARRGTAAWASLGWRNELESPLATTTFWTLTGAELDPVPNAPAAFGRASELRLNAGAKLPWAPFTLDATMWNAGGALGGDHAYHRYRAAVGGGLALGRRFALAPQFEYARLTGSAPAQDLLYLGGMYSLLTVDSQSLSGTGRAVGRVELLMHDDLLSVFGLRRNPAFPLQAGAFATTAARWGYDPLTSVARVTPRDWPGSEQWMSEAGVSLMYRPGLPDPETFFRVDYAWPLGPDDREPKLYVSWKRTLHVLGRR
jgi:hypothetical protein